MKIIDLNSNEITVTDLPMAILQADDYRHYRVSVPTAHDLFLYKYWEDLYQKLLLLNMELKATSEL